MRYLLTSLGFCLLLAGCSSTSSHKPAKELCSGTKRPYRIKGEEYIPQDHYDYDEKGIASWYGPGFHRRPTSCGSTYDMHSYTAAHKTLPIPSVVEVTNVSNGKSLHLVINDRGPFVGDRIIDLSKRAAMELGTHGKGLGTVRVKALPEESVALANHLKRYGRYGIDPSGRGWDEIYAQEIAGKSYKHIPETPAPREEPRLVNTVYQKDLDKEAAATLAVLKVSQEPRPRKKPLESAHKFDSILDEVITEKEARLIPVKAIRTSRASSQNSMVTASQNTHYVQVGNYVQKQNAIKTQEELKRHAKAFLAETKAVKGQKFFTVKLGPFTSKKQAQKVMETVTNKGYHGATLTSH